MAKETLGAKAKKFRRAAERRIARLNEVISDATADSKLVEWAKETKKEILSAAQGTRQYSKTGKRYKSKTQGYIARQIERLDKALKKVPANYHSPGDTFTATKHQIKWASNKQTEASSIYSRAQVEVFFAATKSLWIFGNYEDRERNILNAINEERRKNGLRPVSLDEVMQAVINANETAVKLAQLKPQDEMSDEEKKIYEEAMAADNEDSGKNSPTNGQVMRLIRSALNNMFEKVDPLKITDDEQSSGE